MEAEASGAAPVGPAHDVLVKQGRLLDEQLRHLKLLGFSERIGAGLKIMGVVAGLIAAGALGMMVWNASQDRSLLIQAFSAPPELVERGLTGEVLASKLLDRLARIDSQAQSLRAPETFRNDWGSEIQVEIPQTGVSIGELDKYLRQWLGKRTGIDGEVVRIGDQVAVTVRIGSAGAVTRQGSEADLDTLMQQVAEAVFQGTQPFRYSKYLESTGRMEQAMAVAVDLATDGPYEERAWAWAQISNLHLERGDIRAAVFAGRQAVDLDPELGLGWLNLGIAEGKLGHERASWDAIERSAALLTSGRGKLSETGIAIGYYNASNLPVLRGDFNEATRLLQRRQSQTTYLNLDEQGQRIAASAAVFLHDVNGARAIIGRLGPDTEPERYSNQSHPVLQPRAELAAERGDWQMARDRFRAMIDAAPAYASTAVITSLTPPLVIAEIKVGNVAEAARLAATLPDDCAACVGARAAVAEAMGDRPAADRLFARFVQLAAPGPFALSAWGEAKLGRGDVDGALALFRDAQREGPRWADAYKLEGDALFQQGKTREAAAAYREAIERAPKWSAAHLGLGRALIASGREREGRAALATGERLKA